MVDETPDSVTPPATAPAAPAPLAPLGADEVAEVTDATGRKLTLRALNPGDMLDMLEAAGPASSNQGYMQYATAVCSVISVDGIPVPMARNREQIKGLASRLGNHGVMAVIGRLFPPEGVATEAKEVAKN